MGPMPRTPSGVCCFGCCLGGDHDLERVICADGSIVMDGDWVYVLTHGEIMQIDYFHGLAFLIHPRFTHNVRKVSFDKK